MTESEDLSTLIGDLYDAALDPALWPQALVGAYRFVQGCGARLTWQDAANEAFSVFHSVGDNDHFTKLYFEIYGKMNPLFPAAIFVEPGKVVSVADILPMADFKETRFYKEWVQPQGFADIAIVNLEKNLTSCATFAVTRSERDGEVDAEARRRMQLLVPHVRRAASVGHLIERFKGESTALADTLSHVAAAVFLVNASGQIVFSNPAAAALIGSTDILCDVGGRLTAIDPAADGPLQEVIADAGSGDTGIGLRGVAISLTRSQHERWLAHVLPLTSGARRRGGASYGADAAVFVRKVALDIASPLEVLAKIHLLTAMEVLVLQAVADSGGVPVVAAGLGISETTVKTHPKSLFDKTGARSQVELIKLLAAHGNAVTT